MKKILLATDGSENAEEAAWFLAHLPHSEKLELVVVTVLQEPVLTRSSASAGWIIAAIEREKTLANATFEKIKQMFDGANVSLSNVIQTGHRGETIVQIAKEQGVELVVVGACGHSTVGRILLGSTSDFVATQAHCSVLAIRPTGLRKSGSSLRVAIGYVESDAAHAAMEEFKEIRWGRQAEVHIATVVSYFQKFAEPIYVDTDAISEAAKSMVSGAAALLLETVPNVKTQVIVNDHFGEGLVQFAETNKCDLVVVGETHRNAIGRFLLGSTSRFVLRHAPCSVWIARNRIAEGLV